MEASGAACGRRASIARRSVRCCLAMIALLAAPRVFMVINFVMSGELIDKRQIPPYFVKRARRSGIFLENVSPMTEREFENGK